MSPCEGLCFSFSLHRSPSESEESLSDESLEDEEDEDEEAEEEESDWTPVGSSICTLSAISAISGLSFWRRKKHIEQGHKKNLKEKIQKLDRQKELSRFSHELNSIIFLQY